MNNRPLTGLKVLEMGQLIAGPFCSAYLAGFGAEVIKIEKPKTSVADIVSKIIRDFEIRDWEGKTLKLAEHQYTKNNLPPRENLEALIYRSMKDRGILGDALGNRSESRLPHQRLTPLSISTYSAWPRCRRSAASFSAMP